MFFKEISKEKIQTPSNFASLERKYTWFSNCKHLHGNANPIGQALREKDIFLERNIFVFLPNDLQIKINFCAISSWSDAVEKWRRIKIVFKSRINFPTNKPKLFYCNKI